MLALGWCTSGNRWFQDERRLQVRKIDNGYLVAWHEQMDYKITKASSSLISSFLSGEGFVCSFTGVCQTAGRVLLR